MCRLFSSVFLTLTCSHLLHKPLQLVGELAEVAGGNESEPTFLQTVAGQLNYLVVSEAEHAICQGEDALGRVAADDVLYPFFHLSGGLECDKRKRVVPLAGADSRDQSGPRHEQWDNAAALTLGKRSL